MGGPTQDGRPAPVRLEPGDSRYPAGFEDGSIITAIGNLELLQQPSVALFCSVQCPGRLVNETYILAQRLRDAGKTVIGGFHSPMEQECLRLLLRGRQPVIVCPARAIDDFRIPPDWRPPLMAGRLLILSPFEAHERRVTAELAQRRNRFVAALAHEVFIAYAAPGSSTERFARSLAANAKSLLTLESTENAILLELGARVVQPGDYPPAVVEGTLPLFS